MQSNVKNQLAAVRRSRGVSAANLAGKVGISRQTIYAIEAGSYVPNTEVALRLSRVLETPVEELFSLSPEEPGTPDPFPSEIICTNSAAKGQAVRVCRVGDRLISIPVTAAPSYLPEADGVISKLGRAAGTADVMIFAKEESSSKKLVLAGCDPAIGILARFVEKLSGVELVSAQAASRLALNWLKDGKVHIAGSHLEDPESGEFNLPYLRSQFPNDDFSIVTFAHWEQGFVTAAGNPKQIKSVEDFTQKNVRIANRENGSGSRALLDRLLQRAGIEKKRVRGYDWEAHGHLLAAFAVLSEDHDCCIATRSAARTFGLDFVPIQNERYDFVMRRETLDSPIVQGFLDVLQRASLRRRLEVLAGYDTTETGAVLA